MVMSSSLAGAEMEHVERERCARPAVPVGHHEIPVTPVPARVVPRRVQRVEADELFPDDPHDTSAAVADAVDSDTWVQLSQQLDTRAANEWAFVKAEKDCPRHSTRLTVHSSSGRTMPPSWPVKRPLALSPSPGSKTVNDTAS